MGVKICGSRRVYTKKKEKKHFYSKLLLYLPWRNEKKDLMNCHSYKDLYHENVSTISDNESKFKKCNQSIDSALDLLVEGDIYDRWNELHPAALQEAVECQQTGCTIESDIHQADVEANANIVTGDKQIASDTCYNIHHQPEEMSDNEYDALMKSLNAEQANFVQTVKQWCQDTANSVLTKQARLPPFYSFVSGPGGVGKSHVIKAVYETCRRLLKPLHVEAPDAPTVLLTAPTGAAPTT